MNKDDRGDSSKRECGGERTDSRFRRLLYHPNDHMFLTELMCVTRAQIEAFVVVRKEDEDLNWKADGPVVVGRVGLRCRHCALSKTEGESDGPFLSQSVQGKGAVSFPRSIRLVYQSVRNFQRNHLMSCPAMPDEVKARYMALKSVAKQRRSARASPRYWEESCWRMGMVDGESGIRLRNGQFVTHEEQSRAYFAVDDGRSTSLMESLKPPLGQFSVMAALPAGSAYSRNAGLSQSTMPMARADSAKSPLIPNEQAAASVPARVQQPQANFDNSLYPHFEEHRTPVHGNMSSSTQLSTQCCDDALTAEASEKTVLEKVQHAIVLVQAVSQIRCFPPPCEPLDGAAAINHEGIQEENHLQFLGEELYELFSGRPIDNENNDSSDAIEDTLSKAGSERQERREKKNKRPEAFGRIPLSAFGVPPAICCLVSSLLDYRSNGRRNDFNSFSEIEENLRLMAESPERFLCQIIDGDLRLTRNELYGRNEELSHLRDAYDRAMDTNTRNKEMVLVSGYSGTGKSALVEKAQGQLVARGACFLSGKFDAMQQLRPLSAIMSALDEHCGILLQDPPRRDAVKKLFSDLPHFEGKVLANLIPNLRQLGGYEYDPFVKISGAEAIQRLMFQFRLLLRTTCSYEHPVVLFLDDLHWADELSLELVRVLVMDTEIEGFLFVGCYRDNEIGTDHPLNRLVDQVGQSSSVVVTSIRIDGMNLNSLNSLVSESLHLAPRTTLPLAEALLTKTGGNALFAVQFLTSLYDEGLLRFSMTLRCWNWDIEKIRNKGVADSVVELMTAKLCSLSSEVHEALHVAAAFGAECKESFFRILGREMGDLGVTIDSLNIAAAEGLMVKKGSVFRFSHDQIQLAAYLLIPEHEREQFHLKIGRALWKCASKDELEAHLFAVVDQFRRGSHLIKDRAERSSACKLFLMAGKRAFAMSAFLPASTYFKDGICLLDEEDWDLNRDICFDLFNSCSEAEYVLGDVKGLTEHVKEALTRANTFHEKLRAYYTLVLSMGAQNRVIDAIEIAMLVLEQLGEVFPANVTRETAFQELQATRNLLCTENVTEEMMLNLKTMEDSDKQEAMKFLSILLINSYIEKRDYPALFTCRMLRLSLSHGACKESAFGFSSFGTLLCCLCGDFAQGYRFGKVALSIIKRVDAKEYLARVFCSVYGFINNWTDPVQSSLPCMKYAIEVGLATGDTELAMINAHIYLTTALLSSGTALGPLSKEMRYYSKQMMEYKQHHVNAFNQPIRQATLNLLGICTDPTKLIGEEMDEEKCMDDIEKENHLSFLCHLLRMWLEYLFGKHDRAWKTANKCQRACRSSFGTFSVLCSYRFFSGLVALSLARKHGKSSYVDFIEHCIEQMKSWAASTHWNAQHRLELLNAEKAYLDDDFDRASECYTVAIDLAAKHSFVHDQALALERAGIFKLETNDHKSALDYFSRAHDCYNRWGARSKADHVK